MSRRWCSPSQRIAATASYARRAASSSVSALSADREDAAAAVDDGHQRALVPGVEDERPGGDGASSPAMRRPRAARRGIPRAAITTESAAPSGRERRRGRSPRAAESRARTSRRRRSGRAPSSRDRRSARCTRGPAGPPRSIMRPTKSTPRKGRSLGGHPRERRLDDLAHDALVHRGRHDGRRSIGAHPAGVRPAVVVAARACGPAPARARRRACRRRRRESSLPRRQGAPR